MRLAPLARRTAATIVATALLTTGGTASGLLVGIAHAAGEQPLKVSPLFKGNTDSDANQASLTITTTGTQFSANSGENAVSLTSTLNGTTYTLTPSAVRVSPTVATNGSAPAYRTLIATVDLRQQPPGAYDAHVVTTTTGPAATTTTYLCTSCFTVSGFKPTVAAFSKDTTFQAPSNQYVVSGTDFARGARVTFVRAGATTPPTFTYSYAAASTTSPNPTANNITGALSLTGADGGVYDVVVTNTDGKQGVCTGCLTVPSAGSVYRSDQPTKAAALGQGVSADLVVLGNGFTSATKAAFSTSAGRTETVAGITVTKVVANSPTMLTLSVSVADTSGNASQDTATRLFSLTLTGAGGISTVVTNAVTVSPRPTIDNDGITTAPGETAPGVGSTNYPIGITGSGFQPGASAAFTPATGITVQSVSVTSPTAATVFVNIAPSAPLTSRDLTLTNPDLGVDTGNCTGCITPVAAPVLTSASPPSASRNASSNVSVDLTLPTDTATTDHTDLRTFYVTTSDGVLDPNVTAGTVTDDSSPPIFGITKLFVTLTIKPGAVPGARRLYYRDGNGSLVKCTTPSGGDCFAIDSLAVNTISPSFATNDGPATFTITGTNFSTDPTAKPVVSFTKAGQPDLVSTTVTVASATQLSAVVDLTNASPDAATAKGWDVRVTNPDGSTGVSRAALTITGNQPTLATVAPLNPSSVPAGSTKTITVTGTNFARGAKLTFAPSTSPAASNPTAVGTFVSANQYQFAVTVPASAPVGTRNVTFTSSDGKTASCNACFTVSSAPGTPTPSPATHAPTGTAFTMTITDGSAGTTAFNAPTVTFDGTGVTAGTASNVSAKSFTVPVTVALGATLSKRKITITNGDGGVSSCASCFTVVAGPTVTAISPAFLARGSSNTQVTVTGTSFGTTPSVNLGSGVTINSTAPSTNGTSFTASVSVASTATPRGLRDVTVTNNDAANGGTGTLVAGLGIGDLPGAPTLATPTRADRALLLSWTAPVDDGGLAITGYTVTITKTADGSAVTPTITYSGTSAVVSGLVNGTSYTVKVKATNGVGTGSDSGTKTGTPARVPDAPTNPLAVPGDASAALSWTAPSGAGTGGDAITSYTVTISPSAGTVVYPADRKTATATVTGLTNGTAYTFSVVATNGLGDSGPSADSAAFTPTAGLPGAPTGLTADPAPAAGAVSLSWTPSAAQAATPTTSYVVRVSTDGATPTTVDTGSAATTFSVTGLTNGTAYTFEVAATNGAGTGAYSAPASATPYDVPGQVQGLTATGGDAQASFSWSAPSTDGGRPVSGYTITLSPGGASQTVTTTSASFTGLSNGTTYTASVVATNARGNSAAQTTTVTPARVPINGGFNAVTPARILDTRSGLGAPAGAVAPNGVVALQVAGVGGVPSSGVSAVALNVTAVAPTAAGYVTAYPNTDTRPTASNLNFTAGRTVPNVVVVPLGSDGKVALFNGSTGRTHLLADVAGYFRSGTPSAPGSFQALTPSRVLDTRANRGAPTPSNGTVRVAVTGAGGVPSSGVSAVVLNVTAVSPTAAGYVTAYPSTQARPTASNLNVVKGQTIANLVVVPVGSDGRVALFNGTAGTVHLLADVAGYYLAGTPTDLGSYAALTPARLLDTRNGTGAAKGAVVPSGRVQLQVTGRGGVPSTGVAAVILNVTAVSPTRAGYLTAFPNKTERPTVSNLNFVAGQTVPNLVVVPVGADGKVALFNGSTGTVQMLADVAGYYLQ